MPWSQLWIYFSNSTNDIKRHIWEQIQLPDLLKAITPDEQRIVLDGAPVDVIKLVRPFISPMPRWRRNK